MKQPASPVTLRHVADEVGVSVTTVSRILNGRETGVPVREETRQRILTAAAELGYRPNLLARALRGSRSSLLGIIVRDIADPFHIQVLRGLNDVARKRDYRLFLGHVDYRPDEAAIYGSMFEQSHADGIVILGDIQGGNATLDALSERHRYIVGVTDRIARRRVPGIYIDNDAGTTLAMDHLWGLGHRSIVCVADERIVEGPLRADLYERYMKSHGAADAVRVYYTTQPDPEPSYRLGRQLLATLDRPGRPTAIYAVSDTIAIGLLQAAFQLGIGVPERLSIVGFDDIDIAAFTVPPLTTIRQDGEEMGRIAGELVLAMIAGERPIDDVDDVILQPRLVVRQSTAPASA
jgi:DNA-binding LacI/PurR family transcriptional regulator